MMRARMRRCFNRLSRKALGGICLLLVVFIWVASAELIQFIFHDEDFRAPFFLTYFNTSLFSVYLLGFFFRASWWTELGGPPRFFFWLHLCNGRESLGLNEESDREITIPSPEGDSLNVGLIPASSKKDDDDEQGNEESREPPIPVKMRELALIALGFCPLWFGANYFYNKALDMSQGAASATILSSTSSLFTLSLGFLLGVEVGSLWKLIGVLIALAGVVVVSSVDFDGSGNIFADLMALVGAMIYACYAIYLRVKIPDERALSMPMFFGFVGIINMVLLPPLGVILNFTQVEPFAFPSAKTFGFLMLNGLIGTVLSDYLWVLAVVWAGATTATVGISLAIPFQILADVAVGNARFNVLFILGALLVGVGFIFVNTNGWEDIKSIFKCQCCYRRTPTPAD